MARKPIFEDTSIIIDAAFNIIKDEGLNNFSTRRLASELKVSKNAVSNYLSTKEDIIKKVVEKFYMLFTQNVLEKIKTEEEYYKNNLFDLYIIFADVLYDMISEYGDVYKIATRDFNKVFEQNIKIEDKFKLVFPIYSFLNDDFKYNDHPELNTQDSLDKHDLLTMLMINMNTIELNRTNKIGKEEHMRLFRKAFYLITEKNRELISICKIS